MRVLDSTCGLRARKINRPQHLGVVAPAIKANVRASKAHASIGCVVLTLSFWVRSCHRAIMVRNNSLQMTLSAPRIGPDPMWMGSPRFPLNWGYLGILRGEPLKYVAETWMADARTQSSHGCDRNPWRISIDRWRSILLQILQPTSKLIKSPAKTVLACRAFRCQTHDCRHQSLHSPMARIYRNRTMMLTHKKNKWLAAYEAWASSCGRKFVAPVRTGPLWTPFVSWFFLLMFFFPRVYVSYYLSSSASFRVCCWLFVSIIFCPFVLFIFFAMFSWFPFVLDSSHTHQNSESIDKINYFCKKGIQISPTIRNIAHPTRNT